jgi:hypothetical protein
MNLSREFGDDSVTVSFVEEDMKTEITVLLWNYQEEFIGACIEVFEL